MPSFKDTVSVIREGKVLGKTKVKISPNVIAARATFQIEKGDVVEWESETGTIRFKVLSSSYFGNHPAHYQLQIEPLTPK
jgi:hypothetical protein